MDEIKKLQSGTDYIVGNLQDWESKSISRIAKKCGKIGKMSQKDVEKFDAEKEADKEWKAIITALAVAMALNIRSLNGMYTDEFAKWHTANKYLFDYRGIKYTEIGKNSYFMQDMIKRISKQNAAEIVNLTQTKALCIIDAKGNIVRFQDGIRNAFKEAVGYVKDGRVDFHTAMRKTIQNLGGGGCRVDYGKGITRRLDTVVSQNLLYGLKQAHKEYNDRIGQQIGADGIEIDYHSNSRPSHRYMQGKQYAKGAEGKTVSGRFYPSAEKEGVYDRLYEDYNCRHYETDIILGVSEPRYSPEELKRLNEQNAKTYNINGKDVSGYEAQQMMRRVESAIREQKSIKQTAQASGDKALVKQCNDKIKAYKDKYEEITNITGFYPETERMSVPRKPKTN